MISQPDFSKPEYTYKNIFAQAGYTGKCTWYANGRMQELGYNKEALDTMPGNACDWDNTAGKGCSVTSEPKVNCIANWEPGVGGASSSAGHVAVVEEINGNSILVSEANWDKLKWHTRTIYRNTPNWPSHFILVPGGPPSNDSIRNPALIQSRIGKQGNFELVVPLASGGIAHYFRDNNNPTFPWGGPNMFGTDLKVDAVTLIESNIGNPGNLEVVARVGDKLAAFYRDNSGSSFTWQGPTFFG